MTSRRYIYDIEGNHLLVRADRIWLAVAVDADTGEVHQFREDQMREFGELLANANELIGHNILMYDNPVVERILGIKLKAKMTDTLVISRMMFPDRFNKKNPVKNHSLAAWGESLGHPKIEFVDNMFQLAKDRTPKDEWPELLKWKKLRAFSEPPNDTLPMDEWLSHMMVYCTQDVKVNEEVYRKQFDWIKRNEKPVALEVLATEICAEQVLNGWGYDAEAGEELERDLIVAKAGCLDNLRSHFPTIIEERYSDKTGKLLKPKVHEFNPGSHPQVYARLNLKYNDTFVTPMTENGSPQCDSIVLKQYVEKMPEIRDILTYRDIQKLEGQVKSWNEAAYASNDSRIHGSINVQGAATGRCTHSGPNMAQVSGDKRARSLWVPHNPGEVILGADLSGLELRMLAHYMAPFDEGAYAHEILRGDIHTKNQKAAGLPTRDNAKTFIYGFLYGAGDAKIGQIVGGSRAAGSLLKKRFLEELPALKILINQVAEEAARYKSVTLPDGRRVPVRSEHAALNTLLQGAGAIVSKYWMVVAHKNLTTKFGKNTVKQVAYVHDEMQYSCPKEIAEEAGEIVIASALEAGERLSINMPVEAEYNIGSNWSETH